jgi:PKD repeat protein
VVSGPAAGRNLAVTSYTAAGTLRWSSSISPAAGTFLGDWVAAAPNGDFVAVGHAIDSRGTPTAGALVRFAADGRLLWRVDLTLSFFSAGKLVVDGAGNAYLAWSARGVGGFVQKYGPAGDLRWSQQDAAAGGFTVLNSLALSPDGVDLVATGSVTGGARWITAVYDATTGLRRWQAAADEGTGAFDVAVDTSRVYVAGQGVTGGGTPAIAYHLTVIAYDRSTGTRLWRTDRRPVGSPSAAGLRLALSPDGSLVATGQALRGFLDWFTVALETSGAVRWEAVRDGGLNTDEIPRAVLVLADGTAVVTGTGGPNLPGGFIQGVTAGYGPDGALRWEAFSRQATVWAAALPGGGVCATGGYDALVTCWQAAAPPAPPVAPSGLAGTLQPGAIRLAWQDNSSNETAFVVERCQAAGCTAFATLAILPANATTYDDATFGLTSQTYRVRATNAGGSSPASNEVTLAVLGANDPPNVVLSATPTTGAAPLAVVLDGSGSSGSFGNAIVSWIWSFGDGITGTGPVFTHIYTAPGTYTATLRVVARFGAVNEASTTIVVTPAVLVAPSDLVATSALRARIALAWTNPTASASSIRVDRCRGSTCTAFAPVARLAATATSWADATVRSGTTYRYRLVVSDATGATAVSNVATARAR